jgi:prepilin-type N-terminal cleavage/methylation domain-containing protein
MRRAFTLMEIVIALAILALSAAVLLQAVASIQQALLDTRDTPDRNEAKRFVLRRVLSAASADELSSNTSATLPDGGAVNWSVSLEQTDLPDLHRVTLVLEWGDGDSEDIALWVYRPEWSDPDTRSTLLQALRTEYPQSRFSTF